MSNLKWQPRYASLEARQESIKDYKEQQDEFDELKKNYPKYLYPFFLSDGDEKTVRFLQPFDEILMIFEHFVEVQVKTKSGETKIIWHSYNCREREGLGACAFCETGHRPSRAFLIPVYDYSHEDKEVDDKGQTLFKKVKIYKRGVTDFQDVLSILDRKMNLLKRDVSIVRSGKTYNYMPEDPSDFLKGKPEELKKVREVMEEKIWYMQFAPISYERQVKDLQSKVILRGVKPVLPSSNQESVGYNQVVDNQPVYNQTEEEIPF